MPQLILTILLIAVGWFFLIRPQQIRIREQRAMVASLEVGDRVVTAGGIHGTITALAVETVELEVAAATRLTIARPAIVRLIDAEAGGDAAGTPEDEVMNESDEVAGRDEAAGDQ